MKETITFVSTSLYKLQKACSFRQSDNHCLENNGCSPVRGPLLYILFYSKWQV